MERSARKEETRRTPKKNIIRVGVNLVNAVAKECQ